MPKAEDELRAQCSALRAALDDMRASTSWRVTAPLRAARRLAARLLGAGSATAPPSPEHGAEAALAALEHRIATLEAQLDRERQRLDHALARTEAAADAIEPFHAARSSADYQAAFERDDPLVSVCIATVNRADLLLQRAIPSVLAQTHRRLQVVVVGDHTEDDTGSRLAALGDARIRFVNLPERGPYPRERYDRWLVAGTAPTNHALSLCQGDFVTHLDDDDAMEPTRIAALVEAARRTRADFLWHPFWSGTGGDWRRVGDGRLAFGEVTTGAIFYHRYLASIPLDVHAYRLGEPGDWNRIRRIRVLRPRLHFLDRPLLWHYPERQQPDLVPQSGERFLE